MCASASKLLNVLSKQRHLLLIFLILVIPIGHQMSKKKQPLQIAPPICLASRFKSRKISALVPRRNNGPLRRIGAMTRRQVLRSSPSPPWGGEEIVVLFELSQQN